MKIDFNFAPDTRVTLAASGETESIDLWSRAHRLFEGHAGRVNVFDGALTAPSAGTATVRSDGRTTVNLLDQTDAAEVTVGLDEDRTGIIRTAARAQHRGMPSGLSYWLAQDENGRFLPLPGQRHRKVYVSTGPAGMTKAKIAAHAGVSEATVTGAWLLARPQYGGSEAMPLAMNAFDSLKWSLWPAGFVPRSDWVLLERGQTYNIGWTGEMRGESALHPLVIGAWGAGARPYLTGGYSGTWQFALLRDLEFSGGVGPKWSYGVIYENCRVRGPGQHPESNLSSTGMVTMREVALVDIYRTVPTDPNAAKWSAHKDRISGIYAETAKHLMFDSVLIDHAAWGEGFDAALSTTQPQPPSMYSHGMYLQFSSTEVHVRDSWFSRASSQGIQPRTGGQYERNLFADNNIAAGVHTGSSAGPVGQFNNFLDNVNFGTGYKKAESIGGYDWGFNVSGKLSGHLGNVVAHLADPENPAEVSTRVSAGNAYTTPGNYSANDIQVWNWGSKPDERIEGLEATLLNQTTIQRFAGSKLGTTRASIDQIVAWMDETTEERIGDTVREAVKWAKARFGRPILERTAPANLVFRPNPDVDGFRWDNRYNWSTGDYPGQNVADTVDLDGHDVRFGTLDCDIASLMAGGGTLDVTSGRLMVGALGDALKATVRLSGRLDLGATAQPVTLEATGGMLHLTGTVSALALEARGDAVVLLGSDATVPAGKALILSGQCVRAGWDGTGSATLTVAGSLEFRVGITMNVADTAYAKPYIERGRQTGTPTAQFTIGTYHHPSRWVGEFTLTDLTGTPAVGETFVVGTSPVVDNAQSYDKQHMAKVSAITSAGIPQLQVFRSGLVGDGTAKPTATASVVLAAGSQVVIDRADLLAPGTHDLTGPGVTVTDQGAILPAGVSVTEGRLVLTV